MRQAIIGAVPVSSGRLHESATDSIPAVAPRAVGALGIGLGTATLRYVSTDQPITPLFHWTRHQVKPPLTTGPSRMTPRAPSFSAPTMVPELAADDRTLRPSPPVPVTWTADPTVSVSAARAENGMDIREVSRVRHNIMAASPLSAILFSPPCLPSECLISTIVPPVRWSFRMRSSGLSPPIFIV